MRKSRPCDGPGQILDSDVSNKGENVLRVVKPQKLIVCFFIIWFCLSIKDTFYIHVSYMLHTCHLHAGLYVYAHLICFLLLYSSLSFFFQ